MPTFRDFGLTDAGMAWLLANDPELAADDGHYHERHGIVTKRLANRIHKHEVRFSEEASARHHCLPCGTRAQVTGKTA